MDTLPQDDRHHRRGIVLISTLVTLLLLTALVVAVQQKAQANIKVIARLTDGLRKDAARDAVYERLRGLVADAMTSGAGVNGVPLLNGTPFVMQQGGKDWTVRLQDVEGLVDIYLAPPQLLELLPFDARAFAANRSRALAELQPGERFPTLEASLARFGVDGVEVNGMVTQSSQTGALRVGTMAEQLRARGGLIPPGIREGEQVVKVQVGIE